MHDIKFDLHKLGWKAFEDLVGTVLRNTMGQTVQAFSDGADGGRDAAFFGAWVAKAGCRPLSGSFAVQCKHVSQADRQVPKSVIDAELPKVERLAAEGLADNYLFFTNYAVSATKAAEIEKQFESAGAGKAIVLGSEWINRNIAENPSLRRLVPRLYGLGDLTQIITHQAYRQARQTLDSVAGDLACFVPTDAYVRCAHALQGQGFVILIGDPASGKSTIANLMALSAADEWDLQILMITSPEDFDRLWNADDPGQFFWVDDAFGSNQIDYRRVQEWNLRLPKLRAAIKAGARAVFTSRSYIFRAAQGQLDTHKFELFEDSRVVIEVEKLSEAEKAMMLYNHLKLGTQSRHFLKSVKEFLPQAAATERFLPDVARRFSNPKFTVGMAVSELGVKSFFSNPVQVLEDVIKRLAPPERAAIALVFVNGGNLRIPLDHSDELAMDTIASMQSKIGDVKAALNSLDDSLLRKVSRDGTQYWQFRHPTVRDAFASIIGKDPEQIKIYISGATKERVLDEVTCGDMGIEGAKVVIPPASYERVLQLVTGGDAKSALADERVESFLARKCSVDFLKLYFSNPVLMEDLPKRIRSPYRFDSALTLLARLNEAGLLAEAVRKEAVKRIRRLTETDYWQGLVDGDLVGTLLTNEENSELLENQKDVIYSNTGEIISDIRGAWSIGDDVDDAFYDITRLVERFREENDSLYGESGYDAEEEKRAKKFLGDIESAARALKRQQSDAEDYDALETEHAVTTEIATGRSIFDDVDE
jgi:hypothetical protein